MNKNIVDVVLGAQYGDEAKGKVTHHLCKNGGYTHVMRFAGGCNAGHSIFHNGKKFVTHLIPSGVFFGIKSIVGTGCVLNVKLFLEEVRELEEAGIQVKGNLFVAENVHITTDEHIQEEINESKVGSTRRGIGPTYRDKADRRGIRASEIPELSSFMIDLYEEFYNSNCQAKVLCEGAQGYFLDINWGDYPYVTSSQCTLSGVFQNAVDPRWLRNVWGVAKIYETYVGTKTFEPNNDVCQKLRDSGEEYGATTGRPRQCNWLNLDDLIKSIKMNSCSHLVINKMDVMRETGGWKLYHDGSIINLETEERMKEYIMERIPHNIEVYFSEHKDRI